MGIAVQSVDQDFFDAVKALWSASAYKFGQETGSTGAVDKGVLYFEREGTDRENKPLPSVEMSITTDLTPHVGSDVYMIHWRMVLETRKTLDTPEQSVLMEGIRQTIHEQSLTASANWRFHRPMLDRWVQINGTAEVNRFQISGTSCAVALADSTPLFDDRGRAAFTPASGGPSIDIALAWRVTSEHRIGVKDLTPGGWDGLKLVGWGEEGGDIDIAVAVTAATPSASPIPNGILGSLTIAKDKSDASHNTITGTVLVISCRRGFVDTRAGRLQAMIYRCRWTATVNTARMVVETL